MLTTLFLSACLLPGVVPSTEAQAAAALALTAPAPVENVFAEEPKAPALPPAMKSPTYQTGCPTGACAVTTLQVPAGVWYYSSSCATGSCGTGRTVIRERRGWFRGRFRGRFRGDCSSCGG